MQDSSVIAVPLVYEAPPKARPPVPSLHIREPLVQIEVPNSTYVQHPAYFHGDGGEATITARFWRMEAVEGANYNVSFVIQDPTRS